MTLDVRYAVRAINMPINISYADFPSLSMLLLSMSRPRSLLVSPSTYANEISVSSSGTASRKRVAEGGEGTEGKADSGSSYHTFLFEIHGTDNHLFHLHPSFDNFPYTATWLASNG